MKCEACPLRSRNDLKCEGENTKIVCQAVKDKKEGFDGLVWRLASFAKSAINHAASGFKDASPAVKEYRLSICDKCDHNNGSTCSLCGCVLSIKAGWASEKCPIEKWGPDFSESSPTQPNSDCGCRGTPPNA